MQRQHRDRGGRDRDRDRDRHRESFRRRSRSPPTRRDDHDDYYRASRGPNAPRDRRRSRDRDGDRDRDRDRERDRGDRDRARSPDRRLAPQSRDGDKDSRPRRDDSRDRDRERDRDRDRDRRDRDRDRGRGPREGTADSSSRRPDDDRSRRQQNTNGTDGARTPQPAPAHSEAEKQAERFRKVQAMKQKLAMKEAKDTDATPGSTRELLAKMDQRTSGATTPTAPDTPTLAAPTSAATLSPAPTVSYQGKFDPKAIARNSKASAALTPQPGALGSIKLGDVTPMPTPGKAAGLPGPRKAGILPLNRSIGGFGFQKSYESTKAPKRMAIDLGEEETTKRQLTKLSENLDDTPYADVDVDAGDDDEDGTLLSAKAGDGDAEAARLLKERRDEHIHKEGMAMDVDVQPNETANPEPAPEEPTPMDVDGDVDPLDEFMAGLEQPGAASGLGAKPPQAGAAKKAPEPETYFSDDDDFNYKAGGTDDILAMAAKRKKKDIPKHDYTKIDLASIRKNFWVEPIELSELTEEEAIELRLELDGIKVSGKNAPRPVQKWSQCGLTRPILDAIERLGYEKPTPIQMQALPIIMSGRDVIGVAKTGSGKTMAFVIPMLRHIKDQDPVSSDDGPIALIMTPTRELCTQIHADCLPFAKTLGLRVVAAYGGAPIKDQIAELRRGAEIVVATPGRMIDLLAANQGRVTNLKRATYLVLDEADRMFDMGFEPQVMKIFNNVRPDRQTILFSATMPRIIDALTKKVLREPVEITVGGRSVVAPEITQIVEVVAEERDKFPRVLELLGNLYEEDDDVRALIFVDRQEKADDLLRELLRRGYGCMSIHGGKDQEDRNSTISDFKKGVCPILIATSIAARGLDVKQLKLVINYDAPNHLEDYVHRAGRTGRAGNTGTAVTFITEDQENCTPGIAKALEQSGQPVPPKLEEMRKSWREKVKSGKAKDASGFGGKGLEKLDKEREAARIRERKTHKAEGEEDEDNSTEAKTGGDKGESLDKARAAILAAASGIVSRDTPGGAAGAAGGTMDGGGGQKTPGLGTAATSAMTPGATAALLASAGRGGGALDKATTAIHEINARLSRAGQLRQGGSTDNKGPDAGAFHATLEINDFPQKARWAVTNRTNLAKILEATGTSITNKGIYYPLGKEVPPGGEPKLYILIEGDTEVVVGNALALLTRLLKEGTVAAMEAESRAPASGRYTIT